MLQGSRQIACPLLKKRQSNQDCLIMAEKSRVSDLITQMAMSLRPAKGAESHRKNTHIIYVN